MAEAKRKVLTRDQIRRKFERWADLNGFDLTRNDDDTYYIFSDTRNAYAGFIGGMEAAE